MDPLRAPSDPLLDPLQVDCTTGELKTGEATVPCSVSRIAEFTAQCSTQRAIAPLLADADANKDALCDLKQ